MNVPHASRKDLRDAIEANRKAVAKWAGLSAYNRGQILYRLAEILEGRPGLPTSAEDRTAAIDRLVHHAGWTDKITALLSSLNPVASAYVNYSMVRSLGVVVAVPHPRDGLVGLVEAMCVPLVMADTVTVLVPVEVAELAVALTEAIAVSDVPGGVVNVLTGDVVEVLEVACRHDDVDGLYLVEGAVPPESFLDAAVERARVMRRILTVADSRAATPTQMVQLAEVKTVWMSSGAEIPAGRLAY